MLLVAGVGAGAVIVLFLGTALALVASPPPRSGPPKNLFGFGREAPPQGAPALERYAARDGEQLAYRLYDSAASQVLIFVHGSSYHGAGYHRLASTISAAGAAKVVLPNLRGHYQSGRHRGDIDYVGQLEDDLVDLAGALRGQGFDGPITLGGHSSGGGLVVRLAGGSRAAVASRYLALAPIIPLSPSIRGGTAGGWALLHLRRLFGLLALNAIGLRGLDALPIVDFAKPVEFWDGTETLTYSYRLNTSLHPGRGYRRDLGALGETALVLVGALDQAIDAEALKALVEQHAPRARMQVLSGIDHFGVFSDPQPLALIADWLREPNDRA